MFVKCLLTICDNFGEIKKNYLLFGKRNNGKDIFVSRNNYRKFEKKREGEIFIFKNTREMIARCFFVEK